MPTATLSATYASPASAPFSHAAPLDLPPPPPPAAENTTTTTTAAARAAYLSSLRAATAQLQDRVNAELTARMEQDAAAAAQQHQASGSKSTKADDAAEEENYGEEVVPEDD